MKKMIFSCIGVLFITTSHAVDLTLNYYDETIYSVIDLAYTSAGQVTAITDTYYSFKPFEKTLKIEEQHWLGDGRGGDYEDHNGPYVYTYKICTFNC